MSTAIRMIFISLKKLPKTVGQQVSQYIYLLTKVMMRHNELCHMKTAGCTMAIIVFTLLPHKKKYSV